MRHSSSSPNVKIKQLKKQVSRSIIHTSGEDELLPEEKLTLNDTHIDDSELMFKVKVKSADSLKLERTLLVGPKGVRLILPKTLEEIDDIPYSKMKEFSYNVEHHVFQITWTSSVTKEIETIYFHTKHCAQIHEAMQRFLKEILRARSKDKDPDEILAKCTYLRPANVSDLKRGGRFKEAPGSYSNSNDPLNDTELVNPPELDPDQEPSITSSSNGRSKIKRSQPPPRSQSVQAPRARGMISSEKRAPATEKKRPKNASNTSSPTRSPRSGAGGSSGSKIQTQSLPSSRKAAGDSSSPITTTTSSTSPASKTDLSKSTPQLHRPPKSPINWGSLDDIEEFTGGGGGGGGDV